MKSFFSILVLISVLILSVPSFGQIKLPAVIGDNMVLQQNSEVAIWGWGDPGSEIKVTGSWSKDTVKSKVSNLAEWKLKIKTPAAGGPFTLSIKGNEEVVLKNVMIGEVWICSGQSNMEWSADSKIVNGEEEVKNANHPNIRLFHVRKMGSETPQNNVFAKWETCTPETMRSFSAVGYFFGRNLQQTLNIPVGIIEVAWGGTPAEVWVRPDLVDSDPLLKACAGKLNTYDWWPSKPGVVYNAMIAPLLPYRIAGAIWYQGESNADNYESYRKLFRTLIENWRTDFGNEFPFYYVQIAPFTYGKDSGAKMIREMQMQTMDVPKTGMVVVSDLVDNVQDIHPRNKQDVGKRLANWALSETYGVKNLIYKNPLYKSMNPEKSKVRISFDNVSSGLKATGEEITCFEIAGADQVFKPAKVKIDGNTILVWSKEIKTPVAVRFSWSNDGIGNLFSNEGLPVAPFRTDDWK
ncbi:MAG: sialate O-acetylesterase [Bacteroidales bacterium]|nr:sialate O-acetylesterase [Bacteroidales bacterium]